jgi:hypothetical protein
MTKTERQIRLESERMMTVCVRLGVGEPKAAHLSLDTLLGAQHHMRKEAPCSRDNTGAAENKD